MISYHDKYFRPVNNTANGETGGDTIFHYKQEGSIVFATYSGGKIIKGQLIGLIEADGTLDFCYQQVNDQQQIMTGKCRSAPEILPGGKIRLHEKWMWTSGDFSEGSSVIEEV